MSTFTYEVLKQFAVKILVAQTGRDMDNAMTYIRDNVSKTPFIEKRLAKFEKFLLTGVPQFSIWTEGNSKLPFLSFSGLPGKFTCPGAGDCLTFCYSFKSWRTLSPFMRQLQNEILVRRNDKAITDQLDAQLRRRKYSGRLVNVRLYVDGDFSSQDDLDFWLQIIRDRPSLRVYGYSKSLHLFLNGVDVPFNYKLNLSSGGKFDHLHESFIKDRLGWVRGRFTAVPTVHRRMDKLDKADKAKMLRSFFISNQNAWGV